MRRNVLFHAAVLAAALAAAPAWAIEQEYLWESFETKTTWAVESARGPVTVERSDKNATEGKTSLKLSYEPANRPDFELRRECRLDLSKMNRVTLDVTVDQFDVQVALAFRAGPSSTYYETAPAHLIFGANRNVTFRLDGMDFNRFENPIGKFFQGRDDIRRMSLVFWRGKEKKGEIYVDNLRIVGTPESMWETFAPRMVEVHQPDFIVPAREMMEMRVDFQASFLDFFNPDDISLAASVRDPDGKTFEVPGFLARFEDAKDPKDPKRQNAIWLIRITPRQVGKYEFTVTVKNAMGESVSELKNFTAVENRGSDGFVGISRSDPRSFELDTGKPFWPVGQNVCWANEFDVYFKKMKDAGESVTRVWLCPWGMMVEKKGKLGEYDLDEAAKVDAVLALAQKQGLRVMLVLQYHGMLNSSSWSENAYNAKNQGPCEFASDYFTDAKARKYTKRFLRYASARWGAYTSLMCWELFNEVDLTDYYDPDDVIAWHREMATYLRKVDGHAHLVTSSAVREGFYQKLWKLTELDFAVCHLYGDSLADMVVRRAIEAEAINKPFFVAECAAGIEPGDDQKDPTGVKLHAALWSSYMSPAAGGAMPWWWDTHIDPNNLYGHFAGLAAFSDGEDRRGRRFDVVRAMIDGPGKRRLAVQGVLDHAGGYLWISDPEWLAKPQVESANVEAGAVVNLTGLLDGQYTIDVWGTQSVRRRSTQNMVASAGKLTLTLPAFRQDVAVKVKFLGARVPGIQSTAGWTGDAPKDEKPQAPR